MYYVLIKGKSYLGLDFDAREEIREGLRKRIEENGVRFVQYDWVWDENDQCLLLVGRYERIEEASLWIEALKSMGFDILIRTSLPGDGSCDAN
ncbi:conserved hypothetical protein [uncultured Desulfobacterium sp.]|uniref:SPOR domain-containing protein n=1 Tax=uncultured Desulfobacterium sp. TaxID=201089 RepID=A0A445MUT0_9BACT|nr:conserved hypothetical protein [uncultured Desulfobacterium sp.]